MISTIPWKNDIQTQKCMSWRSPKAFDTFIHSLFVVISIKLGITDYRVVQFCDRLGRVQDSLSTSSLYNACLIFTARLITATSSAKQQALPAQDSVTGGLRQGGLTVI